MKFTTAAGFHAQVAEHSARHANQYGSKDWTGLASLPKGLSASG